MFRMNLVKWTIGSSYNRSSSTKHFPKANAIALFCAILPPDGAVAISSYRSYLRSASSYLLLAALAEALRLALASGGP